MSHVVKDMNNAPVYIRPDVLGEHRSVDISLTGEFLTETLQFSITGARELIAALEVAMCEASTMGQDECIGNYWTEYWGEEN